jgi:predicted ribosome quality control (RQC) complex YloA/Tae2 family protein
VGRSAEQNDLLTTEMCEPHDFWLHLADGPGAHVVVRNPQKAAALPREIELLAAGLAARFSKARRAGWVTVHLAQGLDVQKRRGQPPGEVTLRRYRKIRVRPLDDASFSQLREWTRGSSSGAGS